MRSRYICTNPVTVSLFARIAFWIPSMVASTTSNCFAAYALAGKISAHTIDTRTTRLIQRIDKRLLPWNIVDMILPVLCEQEFLRDRLRRDFVVTCRNVRTCA